MGDTGSLILGFFMFFFLLQLINHDHLDKVEFFVQKEISIWFGLLTCLYPILDSGSVFISRVRRGNSPFTPDNRHIHHFLLNRVESHKMASLIVLVYSLIGIVTNVGVVFLYPSSHDFILAYLLVSFTMVYFLRKSKPERLTK